MDETVRAEQVVQVGATVIATDGEVGTVEDIGTEASVGAARFFVVRTADGDRLEVPFALVAAGSSAREVRLTVARAELAAGMSGARSGTIDAVGDRLVVPVREEVLVPTTRPIELGEVRIHKRVESVPYETLVDVTRDDIDVQRVAVNQAIDAVPGPRQEGETLVIPVVEEVLVTEKRLMLREEIRVTRRQVTEQVPVSETLRREVVEIEDAEVGVSRARGATSRSGATDPVPDAGDLPLT